MNYIVVASPDKVSLGSFVKFLRKMLGTDYVLGEMHSLMSLESIDLYLKDFWEKYPKGIISYYAKGQKSTAIPTKISEKACIVVWFDLYSTVPQVLKDRFNDAAPNGVFSKILEEWVKYITSIS